MIEANNLKVLCMHTAGHSQLWYIQSWWFTFYCDRLGAGRMQTCRSHTCSDAEVCGIINFFVSQGSATQLKVCCVSSVNYFKNNTLLKKGTHQHRYTDCVGIRRDSIAIADVQSGHKINRS